MAQTLAESALSQHFFKFKRPLWIVLYKSGHFRVTIVMSIAKNKLIDGIDNNNWLDLKKKEEHISNMECLAILGLIFVWILFLKQETDLIIPLILDIGINDPIMSNNILYVLISVKYYQKSTDTNYSNNATSMNSLSNVRIEQLSTLLFLSLYMQFSINMSGVDEEYHFPQQGLSGHLPQKQKWKSNVKDNEVNNSDDRNQLLNTMQPLVYTSEKSAISSQSHSTLRIETNIHYRIIKSESSLIPASFNSIKQKLISNSKDFNIKITRVIEEGRRYLQEKVTK
ncbi:9507_t:CDS:2 [Funneliformis mosseae]|uniref:9507_t:CDS:1 n=1 Tax=Funneliformis mosseae TaxID=27381 RepID=A0A9N8YJ60_FUNMO|nr:9507_t:CDS:2 [Funneliformis mosseae]